MSAQENPFLLNFMNMQHLSSLLILLTAYCISHHKVTASPILSSDVVESGSQDNATSYYEGYPQRGELENYSLYLLGHLQGSRALSSLNLALWNQHFHSKEEACNAVSHYLQQRRSEKLHSGREPSRGCEATYKCDYDKYRFPSTLINVDCDSTASYCHTTQDNWPVRGSCLGDQYYLTTLKFMPDRAPLSPQEAGVSDIEISGDGDLGIHTETSAITGRWIFQTSLRNKSCLCLAK